MYFGCSNFDEKLSSRKSLPSCARYWLARRPGWHETKPATCSLGSRLQGCFPTSITPTTHAKNKAASVVMLSCLEPLLSLSREDRINPFYSHSLFALCSSQNTPILWFLISLIVWALVALLVWRVFKRMHFRSQGLTTIRWRFYRKVTY